MMTQKKVDKDLARLEEELRVWRIGLDALWQKWRLIQEDFARLEDETYNVLFVDEDKLAQLEELRKRLNGALESLARFAP